MVSESKLIKLGNVPFQIFDLSAMSVAEKQALKKRLKCELSQVVSAAESIEAQLSRMLSRKFSSTADNCQLLSGSKCPVDKQSPSSGSADHKASSHFKRKAVDMHKQHIINHDLSGSKCPVDKQSPSSGSADHKASSRFKRKAADMHKQHIINHDLSGRKEMMIMEKSESASVVTGAHKWEGLQRLNSEKSKYHKMDVSKFKQCMLVLNKLMNHEFGWVFNQPVDPVKLNIPDYFSIISKPMDLGTIRNKLKNKLYMGTLDFVADVRLTFSNAMRYNPPGNDVHMMAKELNNIFGAMWKTLESKWGKEWPCASQQSDVRKAHNGTPTSRAVMQRESAYNRISLAKKSLSSADRQLLRKDLAKIFREEVPPQLRCFLKRFGFHGKNDGRIKVDIDEFDEEALLELHRLVRSCMNPRLSESQGLKDSCKQASVQELCEGSGSGDVPRLWPDNQKPSTSSSTNGTCSNLNCHCSYHNDFTQALSSDVASERSSGGENQKFPVVASRLTHDDVTAGEQRGNLNHDSDVAVSLLHEEIVQPSFPNTSRSTDKKGEAQPVYEEQLSPSKALRAAMLKSRFADTILKAQQKTLLNNGEKGDPAKMQRERERLKRKQQEERARIEAQVKAAEAAAQRKAAEEMKLQRERERTAARLALQKMEKTVDIDENREILKDLEFLGYYQPTWHTDLPDEMVVNFMDGFESQGGLGNPLEQLGLFIKKDDLDEEAEDWVSASGNGDVEEGEIGPR